MLVIALPDLVLVGIAALLAFGAAVPLTQSDGDLFAHIQLGLRILHDHAPPHASVFGLASHGSDMTAPAWLSEIIVAGAWRVGGLALVAIIAAVTIAAAHATVAALLRARHADIRWVLGGTLMSILLGSSHWLARPHMFSLLLAALLIAILEQEDPRRTFLAVPLMALWANMHGAWLFGLVVMAAYVAGDAVDVLRSPDETRRPLALRGAALLAAAAATLVNPFGIALHRDVIASLADPAVSGLIDEYRPPGYRNAGDLVFLAAVAVTIVILARGALPMKASRLFVVLVTVIAALTAGRNIALFSVTGWPLVALYAAEEWPRPSVFASLTDISRRESRAVVGSWGAPIIVALLAFGILGGRVDDHQVVPTAVDPARFPVAAIAHVRESDRANMERIFTPWDWGGYLVYAWPEQRAFIDPLRFSGSEVSAYGDIVLARAGWDTQLDRWRITTVIAPRRSRLAATLATREGWAQSYADSTATVFRRTGQH